MKESLTDGFIWLNCKKINVHRRYTRGCVSAICIRLPSIFIQTPPNENEIDIIATVGTATKYSCILLIVSTTIDPPHRIYSYAFMHNSNQKESHSLPCRTQPKLVNNQIHEIAQTIKNRKLTVLLVHASFASSFVSSFAAIISSATFLLAPLIRLSSLHRLGYAQFL